KRTFVRAVRTSAVAIPPPGNLDLLAQYLVGTLLNKSYPRNHIQRGPDVRDPFLLCRDGAIGDVIVSSFQLRRNCGSSFASGPATVALAALDLKGAIARLPRVIVARTPLNGRGVEKVFTSPAQIRRRLFTNMAPDRKY